MNRLVSTILICFCSCSTTQVFVGNSIRKILTKVAQHRNFYFLWGLLPLNQPQIAKDFIGENTDYLIETERTLLDFLIGIPLDFLSINSTTTKYYVPMFAPIHSANAVQQQNQQWE